MKYVTILKYVQFYTLQKFHRSPEMQSNIIKFGREAEDVVLGDIRDYAPKYPVEWGIVTN